jgi:signal transduction histidine kinase
MSTEPIPGMTPERVAAFNLDRQQWLFGLAGLTLVAALAVALAPGAPSVLIVLLAVAGVAAAGIELGPAAARLLWRRRSLLIVVVIALLAVVWVVIGLTSASGQWTSYLPRFANGTPFPFLLYEPDGQVGATSWPWRVAGLPLLPMLIGALSAAGGLVLVADAVRVQIGLAGPPRSLWRSLTQTPTRGGRTMVRAIPGVALIGVATFLAMSLTSRYIGDREADPLLATILTLGIGGWAAFVIASPVAVGLALRLDVDKAGTAREEERRRFAAHLHDSVLQTLALIQRQAHDPAAVAKLARRQEHALRAWMAGETDLASATLASAVRDAVAEVEDDYDLTVELTAIGDTRLDSRGEEFVSAAREALRNAARHAPGVAVYVFLDIGPVGAELFVRDNGPGFDFGAVPAERRGLRDAVIGRMAFAGGSASVESTPGEGTEVALRLPINGKGR